MEADYDSEAMTALLTGMVVAGLLQASGSLTQPVTLLKAEPSGLIQVRLASGRLVTVTIDVRLPG